MDYYVELKNIEKNFDKDNKKVWRSIIDYLIANDVDVAYKSEELYDVASGMLAAQEQGKTYETVIGEDVKTFCDELLAELDKESSRPKDYVFLTSVYINIVLIIMALNAVLESVAINEKWVLKLDMLHSAFLPFVYMYIYKLFSKKYLFESRKRKRNFRIVIVLLVLVVGAIPLFLLAESFDNLEIGLKGIYVIILTVILMAVNVIYIIKEVRSKREKTNYTGELVNE